MWKEETKSGKVRLCERYKDPLTDKIKKVTVTAENGSRLALRQAQEELQSKLETMQNAVESDSVTLKQLAEKYLAHQKKTLKSSSYASTQAHIKNILTMFDPDTYVNRLTARIVAERIASGSTSDYMQNRNILYFKAMFNWGYDNDLVREKTWLDKIKRVPIRKNREELESKYLESEELRTLLDALADYPTWQLAAEFLALSGLRIGEMMALKDTDVDSDGIHVTKTYHTASQTLQDTPKTEAGNRVVYVQPELESVIKKIRKHNLRIKMLTGSRLDYFIINRDGERFSYDGFQKQLVSISERVLHKHVTPHVLRHTHTSLLAEQGIPLDTISRRLGHTDSALTLQIYTHITEKRKQKDNEALSKVTMLGS